MAIYRVQGPDGAVHKFEGPDDASPEEVEAAAEAQFGQADAAAPAEATKASSVEPEGMRGGKIDALITGARDPIDALAQLAPRGLSAVTSLGGTTPNPVSQFFDEQAANVDKTVQQNEAEYQAGRAAKGREGFDVARTVGNVASPVNLAAGAGAARAVSGLGTAAKIAAAVPVGAGLGLLQPVTDPNADFAAQKGQQAAIGAVLGPVAQIGANAVSRVIQPKTGAAAKALLSEGVELTPGQIIGGPAKRLEDAATSLPVVGDAIRGARTRGIESFNRAVANRALAPVGKKLPDGIKGRESVAFIKQALSDEYDALLPNIQFKPDAQFAQEVNQVVSMTREPAFVRGTQFESIIRENLLKKMTPQGNMSGASFKQAEETLSKKAKEFLSTADADQRELGKAIGEVLASARRTLVRSNPAQAEKLANINAGYANYARIRQAASSLGAEDGVFTPAQLQNAVKAGDKSVGKGRFAQGDALMQDLSDAGKKILPSKLPDSGTPERAFLNLMAVGGGAFVAPALLVKGLAAAGAYTRPGQYVLRHALSTRPPVAKPLAEAVSKFGPALALPALLPTVPVGQ